MIYKFSICLLALMLMTNICWTQDTVAYYPFDGNAEDASSFANDAMICGALLTQDRFGIANRAFAFDGVQSFIQAPNGDHLQSATATVSFWIKVAELPAQGEVFLLSYGGWQERFKISLPGHGKPVWTTNNTTGISDMDSGDSTNALVVDEWMHVATVHDGAKDLIYINGALANEKEVTGDLNSTTHPLGIGYDPIGGSLYFNGSLDEVMLFNGALSAEQIMDLYNDQNTAPSFANGNVAAYDFTGNLLDLTKYGNHLAGTNTTLVPDRFGFGRRALSFNGQNSEATALNSSLLNSDFTTVTFWINPRSLPAQGEVFVASFGGWQERWKISLPGHGRLVWTTNADAISDMDAGDSTNALVPGTWTHVAVVHDGTKDKIFINGVLANEKDVTGALNSTSHSLGLGFNPIDGGNYFDGSLDGVQIFNTVVSDADIASIYAMESTSPATPVDLVLDLPFTDGANDETQFNNHGHIYGATPSSDRFGFGGSAYQFSGGEGIDVANSVQYNSDLTTVAFWVNLDELPAQGEVYLMSHGGWQERWKISLPSHGKAVWTTNGSTGISDMDAGDGNELSPGTWTHLAFVHGATQDKIYVNGALAATKDVGGTLNSTKYDFGIGYNPIDSGNFLSGKIDEVRLYNTELSDQQIADLYDQQNSMPSIENGLVANYPFAGNARDVTSYRNHASTTATLSEDRFGRSNHAYHFDGATQSIIAQNSPQLNGAQTTVSFWVNVDELPATGEYYLLSFGGWQERWKISLPGHGKPVWTTNNTSGISDMDSGDGNELVPGSWTHVVMVHDTIKDKIYFDGQMVAEKDVAGALNSTTHDFGMGYNNIDVAAYFKGSLDEVRVYNIALTDQEIADLFAEQSAVPSASDTEAPSAPLNLTGQVSFTTVQLAWLASTDNIGVSGYNVWQDTIKILSTGHTNATIENLPPLTGITFGVTAVDSAGNESIPSTVHVTTGMDETPDTIPPSAPMNLTANAGSNSVALSWDPATDDRGIGGYIIFVDLEVYDTVDASISSVVVTGLASETLYTFEVQAFDLAGNLSDLADLTVSTGAPVDTGEDGLVAHYPFDGDANDATPFANHGEIGGDPVFEEVEGRPTGMAIKFDGDRDSVLAANAVQLISDFTSVSFWIRVDGQNLEDAEAYVLDFGHWNQRWKISLPQHLKIVWTTNSKNDQFDNAISDMDSGDGNELVTGFWWHIVMVHDGEDDIIYLDGVEVNRKPAPGILNSTNRPLGMGSNNVDGGQYFNGALDELKIYNRALTEDEVKNLFTTGSVSVRELQERIASIVKIIYPNPSGEALIIEHQIDNLHPLTLRIFDQSGRQIDQRRYSAGELHNRIVLDVASYHSGTYMINFVLDGQNMGSLPFIKN